MEEIVARILERMEEVGYDQKTFAEEIGISPVTITDWKTGKSRSYMKKINIISAALGTPIQWLVFGDGPRSKTEKKREEEKAISFLESFEPESLDIASAYQQADERSRAMVRLALGLDDDTAIAARGGKVVKKPSPVSAETLDELSQATAKAAEKENSRF